MRALHDETLGHMGGALLQLRCFVTDIRVRTRLRSDMFLHIMRLCRENSIELARFRG